MREVVPADTSGGVGQWGSEGGTRGHQQVEVSSECVEPISLILQGGRFLLKARDPLGDPDVA